MYFIQSIVFAWNHPHHFSPQENCEVGPSVSIENERKVSPRNLKPSQSGFKLLINPVSPNLSSTLSSDSALHLLSSPSSSMTQRADSLLCSFYHVERASCASLLHSIRGISTQKPPPQTPSYKYFYCSLCCQNVFLCTSFFLLFLLR